MADPRHGKTAKKEIRDQGVMVRFTPTERERVRKLAASERRSVADYLRGLALAQVERTRNPPLPGLVKS